MQGKIQFKPDNSLVIHKVGLNDADVTITGVSRVYQVWSNYLIKFDTTNMTISYYINGIIQDTPKPYSTIVNYNKDWML